MRHSTKPILPTLALALAACGNNDNAAKSDEGAALRTPAGDGSTATTIHLVVKGGPHPGTYDAKSNDITCPYGFACPGSWGNQYSVTGKKATEFSSLQLIVPDTKVEDRGKSGKVTFQGKTKDNVSLEGTIDCHQLMRSEG